MKIESKLVEAADRYSLTHFLGEETAREIETEIRKMHRSARRRAIARLASVYLIMKLQERDTSEAFLSAMDKLKGSGKAEGDVIGEGELIVIRELAENSDVNAEAVAIMRDIQDVLCSVGEGRAIGLKLEADVENASLLRDVMRDVLDRLSAFPVLVGGRFCSLEDALIEH
jgi:hypothetical protein